MNLNVMTALSFDSLIEVKELFEFAKKNGLSWIGIKNRNLHDVYEVYNEMRKTGVKAVYGCELPFRIGTHVVPLVLYPRTNQALKNLFRLSTDFQVEKKSYFGLDGMKKVFEEMAIVIDGKNLNDDALRDVIKSLKIFFEDDTEFLYVGLHEDWRQQYKEKNLNLREVLKEQKVKFVSFNEVKYLYKKDFESFCFLRKIKKEPEPEYFFENVWLSEKEKREIFRYLEMEDATEQLVSAIHVDPNFFESNRKLSFPVPENKVNQVFLKQFEDTIKGMEKEEVESAAYLFFLTLKGFQEKYGNDKEALSRAIRELKVIISKGFSDYFLIVWDFVKYAKENGIIIGPGRGSVAGSIVAYCLGITEVCPLTYRLQFERFINEYRQDMPDIDIDISKSTREKLIKYLQVKYGNENVAHIMTRSNYGFKKIVTNIGMRVPKDILEKMWNLEPEKYDSMEELFKAHPEAKELVEKYKDIRVLLEQGYRLKNLPFTISTHASGILISNESFQSLPVMMKDGQLITQITNEDNALEKMGYFKFDILGLRNLDIIENVKKLIQKRNKKIPEVNLGDEKTLKLFNEAENLGGIFQFESESAKKLLKKFRIKSFSDVVVVNAMNRPGPLEFLLKDKETPLQILEKEVGVDKDIPKLIRVLKETAGYIIYQEQINEIVKIWSGLSLSEAEMFRKAISKGDKELLKAESKKFVDSALKMGRNPKVTEKLFEIIMNFAKYGFNKSHAVVYSMIAFQMAFLKAHYPVEFYSALLSSLLNEGKKISEYISEAKKQGIRFLPPDINKSTDQFIPEGEKTIRCPFHVINNIGPKTSRTIVELRGKTPFRNARDLKIRVNRKIDKNVLLSLAKVGALDSFGPRHEQMNEIHGAKEEAFEELSLGEKTLLELQESGLIFSLDSLDEEKIKENKKMSLSGIVKEIHLTKDKYSREMAWVTIYDLEGNESRFAIFNNVWKKISVKKGDFVFFTVDKEKIIKNIKSLV